MNILHLAHRIPYPPDKGDKLRAFRQIEHLARRHSVTAAFFVDDPQDQRHVDALRDHCTHVIPIRINRRRRMMSGIVRWLRGGTITDGFYDCATMRRALAQLAREMNIDAVLAFSSSMAPFALGCPAQRRVLDLCDLDSGKWSDYADHTPVPMKWVYRAEGRRLAISEREWLRAFEATLLITRGEVDSLRCEEARDRIHVITNGVTLPNLSSDSALHEPTVGFVGQMDYLPNVDAVQWFARACWPSVRNRLPSALFRIVGRNPTRAVRRLEQIDGIEVTGAVDDIQAELRRIDVSVAPLRIARGLQNKVLEAMAAAKPVVLTPPAAAGINALDGQHLFVASECESFADRVTALLENRDECRAVGIAARCFVESTHNWPREMDHLEAILTGDDADPTSASKDTVESSSVSPLTQRERERKAAV